MNTLQKQVRDFMKKAGQECPAKPTLSDFATRVLRVRLLLEEVFELAQASGVDIVNSNPDAVDYLIFDNIEFSDSVEAPNLLEIADALTDINYVSYGAGVAFGLDLEPFEQTVHSNNLSKIETGYKDENGKWRKGEGYIPVDLSKVLNQQLGI